MNNGERILLVEDEDYEIVETNGRILKTDENTLIVWPKNIKELYWKQKFADTSESFAKTRALFVQWYQEYMAQHPGE